MKSASQERSEKGLKIPLRYYAVMPRAKTKSPDVALSVAAQKKRLLKTSKPHRFFNCKSGRIFV
jgi:hypothetical protein